MNRTLLMDTIWNIYSYVPHCMISKHYCVNKARKSFDYDGKKDISIIAVNCIGGEIYSILGLPFSSPFINTAMNRKEYITMCKNLKQYLDSSLSVHQDNGRLMGTLHPEGLQPIRIWFDHDDDQQEVLKKWERRVKRVNWNSIVLICDDKDLDEEDYVRFENLTGYKRILLTARDLSGKYDCCYQLKAYQNKQITGAYNGKSLRGGWKFQYIWDFVGFLNS